MSSDNSISKFIRFPDVLSLANGLCGVLSLICSISNEQIYAALLIALAGIFDFFDGRMARKMGITSEFGKQLDSLCDLCSFIIAPVVFIYQLDNINIYLRLFVIVTYVLAGILRLARFNVTGTLQNGAYFEGMPVPFSIALVLSYFLLDILGIHWSIWLSMFVIHAVLMVSTLKIRKF